MDVCIPDRMGIDGREYRFSSARASYDLVTVIYFECLNEPIAGSFRINEIDLVSRGRHGAVDYVEGRLFDAVRAAVIKANLTARLAPAKQAMKSRARRRRRAATKAKA
jgi:hypothetical protein